LDSFPLTPNGKLDRRALPTPEAALAQADDYVAPRTPVETALAAIWAEVLGIPNIGVNQNFFETGGDSISALQAVAAIRTTLGQDVSIRTFFEARTIEALAAELDQSQAPEASQDDLAAMFDTLEALELVDE
ncbi:phosphopantetheine-binding protein, partial [Methylobacterium brachythecii]